MPLRRAGVLAAALLALAGLPASSARASAAPAPAAAAPPSAGGPEEDEDDGEAEPADEPDPSADDAACLACHQDRQATMAFDDGGEVSLFVDAAVLQASVHRRRLQCTDCHRQSGELPHRSTVRGSHRAYTLSQYPMCRRCHFTNYTRTLEGEHYKILARDPARAPVCVDCHGAHDMASPQRPRAAISRRCAACHAKVARAYEQSVHGRALLDEDNPDVPVCTDCHRAHDLVDPHRLDFRLAIPALCGRCHADEQRMRPYHLSTQVLRSYLADFHGLAARLAGGGGAASAGEDQADHGQRVGAVCTDCHGVHDIASMRGRAPGELRARLLVSCTRCHPGAPPAFPDAWLPHYQASLSKAPLVLAVRAFYGVLLPLSIGGLLLQILLHILRIAANR